MKFTLVFSILSGAACVGATRTKSVFGGECKLTVVEYLCIEDDCEDTRLTCEDSQGKIYPVLGTNSEDITNMVNKKTLQSGISVLNPNQEDGITFDGENINIDVSNGVSLEKLDIKQGNYVMSPKTGDNKMLLVLIDALDYQVTYSAAQLSSDVFGTNDDHTDNVNVRSVFKACSANALRIYPGVDDVMDAPGTIRVTINMNLDGNSDGNILNAAIAAAGAKLGITLPGSYQNVYFAKNGCYNNGVGPGCGYGAYAGIGSWYSMYPSRYITYSAIQAHEHGHNLGLYHSGEDVTYDDHSCMMGNPLYYDEIGKMCFNPAKSWYLGWYPGSAELVFNKNTNSVMHEKLVGAGEWSDATQGNVVIKIEFGSKDLYVGFNRKAGANSDNKEFSDKVTVTEAQNAAYSYQSYVRADLAKDEEYEQNGVRVKVCDLVTSVVPGYANVVIYDPTKNDGGCKTTTGSPTRRITEAPTRLLNESPTAIPTSGPTPSNGSPTESPTAVPTSSDGPTQSNEFPTESPTAVPTSSDGPTQSNEFPTESPTGIPTSSDGPTSFELPTNSPTESPTNSPTESPTNNPTESPTNSPTESPTNSPTESPTNSPTESPTNSPTESPTNSPTKSPTESPTKKSVPTGSPSIKMTKKQCLANAKELKDTKMKNAATANTKCINKCPNNPKKKKKCLKKCNKTKSKAVRKINKQDRKANNVCKKIRR